MSFLAKAQEEGYIVSVVPQFPQLVLVEQWQPLLDELSQRLGVKFELETPENIPKFEIDFLEGHPDFAFVNPYHVVMAYESQGYIPLISDGSRELNGILVVNANSDIDELSDLEGQTIAFPSPNAFGASLYMRALLAQEGLNFEPIYVETHSNVYRFVFLGQAAAGGGVRNTLSKEDEDLQNQLKIIYETPRTRPHPIVAHPRVPEALREP
ncbi:MAG: phosphate/phosphite/phosphonate ABC transporter substrate-binding protein [Deinococcales bacterium]